MNVDLVGLHIWASTDTAFFVFILKQQFNPRAARANAIRFMYVSNQINPCSTRIDFSRSQRYKN